MSDEQKLGTKQNPHTVAPEGWLESGVEYGAFCRCRKCGLVERSTYTFDFYADRVGEGLLCEQCKFCRPHSVASLVNAKLEAEGMFAEVDAK